MSINLLNHLCRLETYADWKYTQTGNLHRLETYTDWKFTQTGNLHRRETCADWKFTQTRNLHRLETYIHSICCPNLYILLNTIFPTCLLSIRNVSVVNHLYYKLFLVLKKPVLLCYSSVHTFSKV